MDVLRRAADRGRNLIVTHESPYWNRSTQRLADDPLYRAKREFIEAHKLVIYRLRETWQARPVDGQFQGLARAARLGQTQIGKYLLPSSACEPAVAGPRHSLQTQHPRGRARSATRG